MSGVLSGILMARLLSGAVARFAGWRAMYFIAAAMAVLMGLLLAWMLPRTRPKVGGSYASLLYSLVTIFRAYAKLRRAAFIQAGLFGGFAAFWSLLALKLQSPPLNLGSDVAGLFGVLGTAGVLVATLAGRLADRHGPNGVIGAGIALTALGFVAQLVSPGIGGLIAGVLLMDVGVQAVQVANQSVIYALQPDARGRLNTVFRGTMFVGGAVGSGCAGLAWTLAGWPAVCGVGLALCAMSMTVHLSGLRRR